MCEGIDLVFIGTPDHNDKLMRIMDREAGEAAGIDVSFGPRPQTIRDDHYGVSRNT